VVSVRPIIVDPEITNILVNSNVKYNSRLTTKSSDTLKSDITDKIAEYNLNVLQKFDGVFRYSKFTSIIDNTDASIVSNITTIKIKKTFKPILNSSNRYDIYFRNALYNPVTGYNATQGGILESTGFKIDGDTANIYFLDDDGSGNIRRYTFISGIKTYANTYQGSINYLTGHIILTSLNISQIQNINGAASIVIELTVKSNSNDIVPVRDQIIELDIANSIITVEPDTFIGGSANAGVGYNTSNSF
jgi:hypothetical protein